MHGEGPTSEKEGLAKDRREESREEGRRAKGLSRVGSGREESRLWGTRETDERDGGTLLSEKLHPPSSSEKLEGGL